MNPSVLAATVEPTAVFLPAWAQVLIALLGVVSSLGLAWIGYLQHQTRKDAAETKVAAADTAVRVRETERKVTSNHGHDNIGDKVDKILEVLPEIGKALRGLGQRVEKLEDTTHETAAQVADNSVIAAAVFEDLRHDIEDIAPPKAQDGKRYCRRKTCNGNCGYQHRP